MTRTIETERTNYLQLWNSCVIRPEKLSAVDHQITHLVDNKKRYEEVSKTTGVPWYVIALIHSMESGCNFNTHLHNGDPLTARTVQVPAGRPKTHLPPFTWEESAIDALGYDHLVSEKDWSVEAILFRLEGYNGWGYRSHNCNSAYLWSYTMHYTKGRYVADGQWSDTSMSSQCGAAAMLKRMADKKIIDIASPNIHTAFIPLKLGDKGDRVVALQTALKAHGFFAGELGGNFGPITLEAVTHFQQACHHQNYTGIQVTGILDEATWKLLTTLIPGSIKHIDYSKPETPTPTPPPVVIIPTKVISDAYTSLLHTKDVKTDLIMTEQEGKDFYQKGMLPVISNKLIFNLTVAAAVKPAYNNAQCAITTAGILEKEFFTAGMDDKAQLFRKSERDADHFALTHQIEIILRRLGWFYYLRAEYVAPMGAIGLMSGRYRFVDCAQHSGHVYSIYEDLYPSNDIICDNGGWHHAYLNKTEGFWLPPGVCPVKRDSTKPVEPKPTTSIEQTLIAEAKKWIGIHEIGGNNKGPDVERFQKAVDGKASGEPWCMSFCQFCVKETEAVVGKHSLIFRSEHCLTVWRRSPSSLRSTKPVAGSLVIWQHGTSENGHTGIVTDVSSDGKTFQTVEGNTSDSSGVNREGDGVYANTRSIGGNGDMKVVGFLRLV
jgi:lysozyme family protein